MVDLQITFSLIQDILNNIDQEDKKRNWNQVMNLKNATYTHEPDQAEEIIAICLFVLGSFGIWFFTKNAKSKLSHSELDSENAK